MGQRGSKITSQDRAILDLKIQRDRLKQYQKKILVVVDKETQLAKEAIKKGDRRRALLALKKKKYQQQLLIKTDTQLLNLEELTQTIEFAVVQKEVLAGLAHGRDILNELNNETSIEKVEELMDDTAEAIAYQKEIEELLSGKITNEGEEEILKELEEIEKQQITVQMDLPSVPITPLPLDQMESEGQKNPQKVDKKLQLVEG
ncbi:hypothetical protein G9A89_021402 [Geosiphon pyriformis]|nr:hypothetical protein G9A89_021402 [Geosiphon pyriformis]